MDQSIKDYSRQVSGQTKMASVRDGSLKPLEYSDFDGRKMDAQPSNPVTVFDKIKKGESKRIARVAEELAGLQQSFAGYRATSNNPSYKYV